MKRKKPLSLSTFCAVLPSSKPNLSEESFGICENVIKCPDSSFQNSYEFPFQQVFNGIKDLQYAYESSYSSLIKQTAAGESTMLMFCGLPLFDQLNYFTSVDGRVGLIHNAAQTLLRATNIDAKTQGTVTLSWFKIDCGSTEAITDILKTSSPLQGGKGGPDPNLVLRELGKGRGMVVPGLWEVELSKPSDADAVISHVLRMLPSANHDSEAHSVFQLTVSPDTVNHRAHRHTGNKAQVAEDIPGLGRLTIVLLSHLSSHPSLPPTTTAVNTYHLTQSLAHFNWVTLLTDILKWIETCRPSPPFHKSRILLLLRDALCGRMNCAASLLMYPIIDNLADNCFWLQMISKIHQITTANSNAVTRVTATPSLNASMTLAALNPDISGIITADNLLSGAYSHPGTSLIKGNISAGVNVASGSGSGSGHVQSVKVGSKQHAKHIPPPPPPPTLVDVDNVTTGNVEHNSEDQQQDPNIGVHAYEADSIALLCSADTSAPMSRFHDRNFKGTPNASKRAPSLRPGGVKGFTPNYTADRFHQQQAELKQQYIEGSTLFPDADIIRHASHHHTPPDDSISMSQGDYTLSPIRHSDEKYDHNQKNLDLSEVNEQANLGEEDGSGGGGYLDDDFQEDMDQDHELQIGWEGEDTIPADAANESRFEVDELERRKKSHGIQSAPRGQYVQSLPLAQRPMTPSQTLRNKYPDKIDDSRNRIDRQHVETPLDSRPMLNSVNKYTSQENKPSSNVKNSSRGHTDNNHRETRRSNDTLDSEGIRALLDTLETSRMEVSSLKRALTLSQDSANHYKSEMDRLQQIRHEEGSSLKTKDRSKFLSMQQELKDYDVYREVMEAAMSRMQNEIDKYDKENMDQREQLMLMEKELRKGKSLQQKLFKDVESTSKTKGDLGKRVEYLQEEVSRLSREKEAFIQSLAACKTEKGKAVGELTTTVQLRDNEVAALKKKLAEMENKVRGVQTDHSAVMALHEREMEALRAAQKNNLLIIENYQEENDLLRSAMADLMEESESNAHPISGAEMGSENQQRAATVSSASQEKFLVESDEEST